MFLTTLIAFISLISLVILHELGHFLLAKKFGVKVEEFGIGYPPRLFGKKIGETVYSINLLPFGAFVRLPGEIERVKDRKSFSQQPVGKRALIVLGGVLSFWVIAAIIFSIIFNLGAPVAIDDESNSNLIDPKVQIAGVSPRSPAKIVGLRLGDTIKQLSVINEQLSPTKIKEVQKFTNAHLGEEVTLTIERGKETFEVSLFSRISPPEGEGP
ncbi:MAG: site-2 protease family protein, partial [Candidatus Paceibacterales bacterium]